MPTEVFSPDSFSHDCSQKDWCGLLLVNRKSQQNGANTVYTVSETADAFLYERPTPKSSDYSYKETRHRKNLRFLESAFDMTNVNNAMNRQRGFR